MAEFDLLKGRIHEREVYPEEQQQGGSRESDPATSNGRFESSGEGKKQIQLDGEVQAFAIIRAQENRSQRRWDG